MRCWFSWILILILPLFLQGQSETEFFDLYAEANVSTAAHSNAKSSYYRFHKKLPALYTGYVVEIVASNYPLERAYPLFRKFGTIHYDKLREGGYSYCILPNFSKRKTVERYFANVIAPKAPEARIIQYKKGIRRIK
ncbi:MAG: hypothetical protein GY705_31085 [Bacteroidetes bacterium]|nr:hypothetical protein [Bacteroidota bacterium]